MMPVVILFALVASLSPQEGEDSSSKFDRFIKVGYDDVQDLTAIEFQLDQLSGRAGRSAENLRLELLQAGQGREPATFAPIYLAFTATNVDIEYSDVESVLILADGLREVVVAESEFEVVNRGFLERVVATVDAPTALAIGDAKDVTIRVGADDFSLTDSQKAKFRTAGRIASDSTQLVEFLRRIPTLIEAANSYNQEWQKVGQVARRKSANAGRSYMEQRHQEIVARISEEFGVDERDLAMAVEAGASRKVRIVP